IRPNLKPLPVVLQFPDRKGGDPIIEAHSMLALMAARLIQKAHPIQRFKLAEEGILYILQFVPSLCIPARPDIRAEVGSSRCVNILSTKIQACLLIHDVRPVGTEPMEAMSIPLTIPS